MILARLFREIIAAQSISELIFTHSRNSFPNASAYQREFDFRINKFFIAAASIFFPDSGSRNPLVFVSVLFSSFFEAKFSLFSVGVGTV